MRHRRAGSKLGRDSAHRRALYSNLTSALIEHGRIKTTEAKATIAADLIPIFREGDGAAMARGLKPVEPLKIAFGPTTLSFPLPRGALPILAQIDGRRPIGALRNAVAEAGLTMSESEFDRNFVLLYGVLNGINHLFLANRPLLVTQAASAGGAKRI